MLGKRVGGHVLGVDPTGTANLANYALFSESENQEALRAVLRNTPEAIGELSKI